MFRETTKNTTKPPELEMTPMIDIVFQLLAFFLVTFRITALEGDFKILLPIQTDSQVESDDLDQPVIITLKADADRRLESIQINDNEPLVGETRFEDLNNFIAERATGPKDPTLEEELVVEFVIDYKLRYEYSVQAITAVVGKKMSDGTTKKFADQIKFRDQGARIE